MLSHCASCQAHDPVCTVPASASPRAGSITLFGFNEAWSDAVGAGWQVRLEPLVVGNADYLAGNYVVSIVHLGHISGTGTTIDFVTGCTVDGVDKVVAASALQDVATGFPEYRIITTFAIEDIIVIASLQPVIARTTVNPVCAGRTVQAIPSSSADHIVLADPAVSDASSSTGVNVVVILAARQGVRSFPTVEPILATKPDHTIYAGTTKRMIRFRSAVDTVAAFAPKQAVPAGHALHAVVPLQSLEPVVAGEAEDRVRPQCTFQLIVFTSAFYGGR